MTPAHAPSRDAEAAARVLAPRPMSPDEIADLVERARSWRAPRWTPGPTTDRNHVARLIRQWRVGLGWSTEQLANRLRVSDVTVRAWQRGAAVPQARHEQALRDLGCPLPVIVRADRRGQRDGYVWRGKWRRW